MDYLFSYLFLCLIIGYIVSNDDINGHIEHFPFLKILLRTISANISGIVQPLLIF